ncbi:MAG: efflux RND transporter permease subunit [Deltaproteobacteria bacterium]
MIISDTAVDKRVSVAVLAVLLIVFGIYCYNALPRESEPDITIPYVFISTDYRGVSPPDIEQSITIPIEKKLSGLESVKKIQSVSAEGLSSITIEFLTGTDIDLALRKVKDKVDEAKGELPGDLEDDPQVFEVNFSEMPIVVYSLSGTVGAARLKKIADDLADDIETIPGVLEVEVTGGLEREIRVEVLPEKLSFFHLSPQQVENTLRQENQNISGGIMHMGDGRFQLQVPGELKTPEEFLLLTVGTHEHRPVYLKDVAMVYDGYKEESSRSRLDGRTSVNIMVKKRAGENIIAITDKLDHLIKQTQAGWPLGTKVTKLMDKAKDIRLMVADLENNLLTGLCLVLLVLPMFLGFRSALLVSLAIPFSMFLSFIVLKVMGITLNMVVLFSLTLALGMLVDNAIVIVENIYRFTSNGVGRVEAAKKATSEVAYPVIGSTLTTLAAFFPMLFWPGIMGEFMRYLPITLIVTLTSSLAVALVINPAFASYFIKQFASKANSGALSNTTEAPPKGLIVDLYRRILHVVLNYRLTVIAASFCILVIFVQLWMLRVGLVRPVEFFPAIDPPFMYVNMDMPEGADLDFSDRVARQVEMAVADRKFASPAEKYPDPDRYQEALTVKEHQTATGESYQAVSDLANVRNLYATVVASVAGAADLFSLNTPNHIGVQFLDFKDRSRPSRKTLEEIRHRLTNIAGGKITITEAAAGPPTGAPINIEISGDDFTVLAAIADRIKTIAAQNPYVEDIRDDYEGGTPTIRLVVDRKKAATLGFSAAALGQALKNAYNGIDVSTYREKDDEYDITVQLPESYRLNTNVLQNLMITGLDGSIVPLSTMASFEYTGSLGRIVRINNQRVVTVKANVDEDKVPAAVARARVQELIKNMKIPPGYQLRFTGEQEEQDESENFLKNAFAVAVFLVFLVLVTQFNSIGQPFIILTSVILSLGGAFLGLTLFNQSFGIIMTGVGIISLAGVVVNNAIVLIDYTNLLRSRGVDLQQAIITAGCTRLRPVLLTAITTILGLIPMVTGVSFDFHIMAISWHSESSQWWNSMALAVIFGLMVATLLTLFVVPALYSLFENLALACRDALARRSKAKVSV